MKTPYSILPLPQRIVKEIFDGFSVVTSPTNGVASVSAVTNGNNATATLTYAPNSDFNGTDTVRVRLIDTAGLTDFIDVSINVIAQNDTPSFTTVANLSVLNSSALISNTIVVSSDDGDPEVAQGLSYSIIASNALAVGVSNLAITSTGVLSFTPTLGTAGNLTLTVQLTDDGTAGGSALSTTEVVIVQILNGNTAPSFNVGTINRFVGEDGVLKFGIPVTDNEGNFNNFSISINPNNGVASISNVSNGNNATVTLTYRPSTNYNGTNFVRITVADSFGLSAFVNIFIDVVAINDQPSFTTVENLSVLNSSAGFSNNIVASSDDGDPEVVQSLTYSIVTSNASAVGANSLSITNSGVLSFTPTLGIAGILTVTVRVIDDVTASGAPLTKREVVTVEILDSNTAPVFSSSSLSVNTNEDTAVSIAIPATDAEGNFNGFSVATNPANGSASITDVVSGNNATVTLTYTPNSDFNGADSIRVNLVDTSGLTGFIDVSINVAAQNDVPSFTTVTNLSVLSSSAGFSNTIVASSDDGDPELVQGLTYSIIASNATTVGANNLAITSTGVLTFAPTLETIGILSVTVQVIDDGTAGGAALTSTQVVTVQILDGNSTPSFNSASLNVNTNEDIVLIVAIPATDSEGNFAGFSMVTNPVSGVASISDVTNDNNATVTLTYTPNSNFNGTDFIQVGLVDSLGLTALIDVTINIVAQNDVPSFTTVTNLSILSSSAGFSSTIGGKL